MTDAATVVGATHSVELAADLSEMLEPIASEVMPKL
jgi:hypothetical protein